MNKFKTIGTMALLGLSTTTMYAAETNTASDSLSPVGYWVQFDEDDDAGKGRPEGIIQSYLANDGTLSMKIVVPLMEVSDKGKKINPPMINCSECGKGSKNGFEYNYTDPKTNFVQGLIFSGNIQKIAGTKESGKSDVYDRGGVLNPNDGKTYSSMVQVQDNGDTLFARAYLGPDWNSWRSAGKNAHWKRINEATYESVKAECGLTAENVYPYQSADKSIKDQNLYKKCTNYPFDVKKPF